MAAPRKGFETLPEVREYFSRKGLKPAFSSLDVAAEEHAHAMTVAKAVELELLAAFRRTIQAAIDNGDRPETFEARMRDELARLGWLGPRLVTDPAGIDPARKVDFSSSRRLRTIYHSNVASARAAGQWLRAQRTKDRLPYFLYVRTSARDPRPEHLAWAGTILPVDHPWWDTHFPPNGWLCKCSVMQIDERRRAGYLKRPPGNLTSISTEPPINAPPRQWRNRRTGAVVEVPAGIDPGWQTNPGKTRTTTLLENLEVRLGEAPEKASNDALKELWHDPYLRVAPKLPTKSFLPAGVASNLSDAMGARSPVVSVPTDVVADRMDRHGMSLDDFALLPSILGDGHALPDPKGNSDTRALYWRAADGKTWWRAFVRRSVNGWLRITSLHQRDRQAVKAAAEAAGYAIEDLEK